MKYETVLQNDLERGVPVFYEEAEFQDQRQSGAASPR
jgi:hypothetical protein